ncbi:MAG: cytochrome C assembly protein [Deltaproteobacteria bacterium]|nr:cytochrome C assembly protein [Deltaproteobacteria bacterium]
MGPEKIFELLIIVLYFSGAVLFLGGLVLRSTVFRRWAMRLAGAGFGLHSVDIGLMVVGLGHENFTQAQFHFSLMAWLFLAVFFFLCWRLKIEFLSLAAAPLALILFTSSLAVSDIKVPVPETLSSLWFGLHVGSLFISMALLALACGAGMCYLYLERRIKTKAGIKGFAQDLPSLSVFDKANHWAVMAGFPLYTAGMLSGFIWAAFTWKQVFSWDPKELISIVIWSVYGYLFHQRLILGWQGRKPAKIVIWLFVLTILSMTIINLMMPTHHSLRP